MFKRALCLTIAAASLQAHALDINPANTNDSDIAVWVAYRSNPSKANFNSIIALASQSGHSKAKNYAGCIIGANTVDKERIKTALRFFDAAGISNDLATFNSGLMMIKLNGNQDQSMGRIKQAYKSLGMEEAGAQILVAGYKNGQIDSTVLDEMLVLRSPIAFYMKSYMLFNQKQYSEALQYSSQGAEMSDINSIVMQAQIYSAIKEYDSTALRAALTWSYIHKMMINPNIRGSNYQMGVAIEDLAWNDALTWVSNHEARRYEYSEPLCEPKKMIHREMLIH